jgi:Glycosyltransferase 61
VIGLDEMDYYTFDATDTKDKGIEHRINAAKTAYDNDSRFAWADGMIKIERFGCNNGGINKPWQMFIDSFPATLWHNSIIHSGLTPTLEQESSPTKFVACYIDRQNTDRKLPDEHHSWLVETLQSHASVLFLPLHMEEYSALEQIQKASRCDLMVGMHGNGLTHSLWMKPGGYVVEFFWKYNFQYDYATAAQLMKHQYLGIFNGRVLNETLVRQRDPSLRLSPTRREAQREPVDQSMANFEEFGKPAIVQRLHDAIHRKLGGRMEESASISA